MDTILAPLAEELSQKQNSKGSLRATVHKLLFTWELYPILVMAAFLRLYRIDTAVFVDDDAVVFRLARDLFTRGLLPITSNRASLGNLNPPMVVYLFMLPASISGNPLFAEIMVGLFNVAAVLLTYFFTRRYYGRIAGTAAGLFYATAVKALLYSRNIWPQNLLPLFAIFFMFMLFRGVVERKKGWFVPAAVLITILYQLHGSGILMLLPFAVAVLFAYKTLRWHDIVLAAAAVLLLFAPYLYWEYLSHWSDVHILLNSANGVQPSIDTQAIESYKNFLSPYIHSLDIDDHFISWPTFPDSIFAHGLLAYLKLPMFLQLEFMWLLLHCSLFTAVFLIFIPLQHKPSKNTNTTLLRYKNAITDWWMNLYTTPSRQGLLLLICWQVTLLALIRHTIILFPHYFIIFLPGPFILIALFLGKIITFVQKYQPDYTKMVRYALYLLIVLITASQFIGSAGSLADNISGRFDVDPNPWWPGINDLTSVQNVLAKVDKIAQTQHIHRIYFAAGHSTANPVSILAEQIKTPITIFDTQHCTILPDPSTGPAIFVSDTGNAVVNALISRYTHAKEVAQVAHLHNFPFLVYILTTKTQESPPPHSFTSELQPLEQQAHVITGNGTNLQWIATYWRIMHSTRPAPFTTHTFNFQAQQNNFICSATTLWSGDHVLLYQNPADPGNAPASIDFQASTYDSSPANYPFGPLTLTTFNIVDGKPTILKTDDGKNTITFPVS